MGLFGILFINITPAYLSIKNLNFPYYAGVPPKLPAGDRLHHKFGVVDGTTVITGSHNWSEAANRANDETLLVIESAIVAAHFEREFDRLYHGAILGIPHRIKQKIDSRKSACK